MSQQEGELSGQQWNSEPSHWLKGIDFHLGSAHLDEGNGD
jgi:hypothetical protein